MGSKLPSIGAGYDLTLFSLGRDFPWTTEAFASAARRKKDYLIITIS
jgi:hypothetical protein